MTVIAWDGKTLAADKQATYHGVKYTTNKLHRLKNGSIAAGSGSSVQIATMINWLDSGADPKEFPKSQEAIENTAGILVITKDKRIMKYESTPYPLEYLDERVADGSGHEFALCAMYLGKTAKEAVEVACVFDTDCGMGVDTIEL